MVDQPFGGKIKRMTRFVFNEISNLGASSNSGKQSAGANISY